MEHLLNATLAGGVVIGATAGIILHPGGSIAIGFLTGIISTFGFHSLTPYLEKKINLYDTCGVHNLHGIPGLLGGIVSAIVAASYYYPSASDAYHVTAADFSYYDVLVSTPFKQGGLQIAGTLTSIGIGVATAIICGVFLKFIYSFNEKELFSDVVYFEEAEEFMEELNHLAKESEQAREPAKLAGAEFNVRTSNNDSISNIKQ